MHSRILVRDADFRSVIFFRTRTCIDPFKESARFLAAEICFGLFARSRSTLHGISQKPLTFRSRSAGFDCRSETGRALRTSLLLLSWLLRSYPKLPISTMIQRCCIKPSDASNGSSETRSFDFRALPSNLVDASSTDATNTGDGYRSRGDPLPTSKESRRLGGRLSSLRAPIAHATFLFLAGSKNKTPVCVQVATYTPTIAYARSVLSRAAHNDQS